MSPSRRVAAQVREVEKRAPAPETKVEPAAEPETKANQAGGTEPHASASEAPAEGKEPETQQEPDKA
jgi:hypothetical protein